MIRDPASLTGATSRSEAALQGHADADDDEYEDEETEGTDEANWGLPRKKAGMSMQTVLGLTVIVVLLGMFSFLIYRKLEERKANLALQSAEPAADSASKDAEKEKNDLHGIDDKGKIKTRGLAVKTVSHSKAKNDTASGQDDPFNSFADLPEVAPKSKSAGAGRANSHTPNSLGEQHEPFDAGLSEPAPRRTAHTPEKRNGLPEMTDLDDEVPAGKRAVGSTGRTSGGHASLGSGRPPAAGSAANEMIDLSDLEDRPAPKAAKVGGHSSAGTLSSGAPATTTKAKPKRPADDEFPISSGSPSDPFSGNEEPPTASKREAKPAKTSVVAREPAIGDSEEFDPTSSGKPKAVRRLPVENRLPADSTAEQDRLGGFEVAKDPLPKKIPVAVQDTEPSLDADTTNSADDPRLGGFQPVENNRTRAVSRTIVTRPAEPLHNATETHPSAGGSRRTALAAAVEPDGDPFPTQGTPAAAPKTFGVNPRQQPTPVSASLPRADLGHNPTGETYVIAPNDNFWMISRKLYGTGRYFQALTQYNKSRIADPSRMRPGTVIATPPREVLEKQFPQLIDKSPAPAASPATSPKTSSLGGYGSPPLAFGPPSSPNFSASTPERTESGVTPAGFFVGQDGQPMYRVGQGDTLSDIAQRHLGRGSRWEEIYNRNTDVLQSRDALKIGTVIRLPTDASRVGFVPNGSERR